MSKLLVVFGATGQQGGSVVDFVLNDSKLSQVYKVRAVTRQPSGRAAQQLNERGVDIVSAELDDEESVKIALKGAHTVFGVTTTIYDDQTKAREVRQGKAIANAAVANSAEYLIFSTLPSAIKISNGKYKVDGFDGKADVEDYIRSLPIQSAFFAPGAFMENFGGVMGPHPSQTEPGTYAVANVVTPETKLPLIATVRDTGKYVGAILSDPEGYQGKVLSASTDLYSFNEIVETMSKLTGKTVKYVALSLEVFRGLMPPIMAESMVNMMMYYQDYGYFGPGTKELVDWTAQHASGKLTTLEEYLRLNPLHLE